MYIYNIHIYIISYISYIYCIYIYIVCLYYVLILLVLGQINSDINYENDARQIFCEMIKSIFLPL